MMGSNLIYNLDEVQMGAEEARRLAQFEAAFIEPEAVSRNGDTGADGASNGSDADASHPNKIRRRDA